MEEKAPVCEVCGGQGKFVHKGTRDSSDIIVYECTCCGTKFLSVNEENDYENGFMYATNNMSELDIQTRLERFRPDDVRRVKMIENYIKGKRVLDFGCGYGSFLREASGCASELVGVDLGIDERKWLQLQNFRCYQAMEELKEEKFDVITLFHTFEHLTSPRDWLNVFCKYLVEDGLLIIEVPSAKDVLLSLYECEKYANFSYWSAHIFLYTMEGLEKLIKDVGKYEIVAKEYVQRYSFANHAMWLAKGQPGGHEKWKFLDSDELNAAYAKKMSELGLSDTL